MIAVGTGFPMTGKPDAGAKPDAKTVLESCWVMDEPFHDVMVCTYCEWPKPEHEPSCPCAALAASQERVEALELAGKSLAFETRQCLTVLAGTISRLQRAVDKAETALAAGEVKHE